MKHVDVGEKIGGARKDFYSSPMRPSEVERLSAVEIGAFVKKANVWPAIDWQAKRDAGMTPQCANLVKFIKDEIPTEPVWDDLDLYSPKETARANLAANYVKTVGMIRDALEDPLVKKEADVLEAMTRVFEAMDCFAVYGWQKVKQDDGSFLNVAPRAIFGAIPAEHRLGEKFADEVYRPLARAAASRTTGMALDADFDKKIHAPQEVPFAISRRTCRRVASVPEGQIVPGLSADKLWAFAIKPKRTVSEDLKAKRAAEREENMALHRPHLEKVVVEGARRSASRNVTATELMDEFGFRAVEFGNWLPDDERQDVLNFAYDSFGQLAEVLDVPRQAVGFNGKLAVAFGSRGHGGVNAALAHFEPLRNVINLTRLSGAGTLAHEWMHAFDHNVEGALSARMTKTMTRDERCADDLDDLGKDDLEKAVKSLAKLVRPRAEDRPEAEAALMRRAGEAAAVVALQAEKLLREESAEETVNCRSVIREAAGKEARLVMALAEDMTEKLRRQGFHTAPDAERVMEGAAALVRSGIARCAAAQGMKACGRGGETMEIAGVSLFWVHAKKLDEDQRRRKSYWSDPKEMFARAGACWVSDKIAAAGMRNDYLVFGADEAANAWRPADPNTRGRDRRRIGRAFEETFARWRTEVKGLGLREEPIVESAAREEKAVLQTPETGRDLRREMDERMKAYRPSREETMQQLEEAAEKLRLVEPKTASAEDAFGFGGLFASPLVLAVRESRKHQGKAILQILDDSDLSYGAAVSYQLFDAADVGDVVHNGRLAVQGPTVSAPTIANERETVVEADDTEKIFVGSRASLEREMKSAEQMQFRRCLNQDAVLALACRLEERRDEIRAHREAYLELQKVEAQRRPKRRSRCR